MSFDEQPDAPIHGECEAEIHRLEKQVAAQQARIDELMLECCPDEMTQDQVEIWKKASTACVGRSGDLPQLEEEN